MSRFDLIRKYFLMYNGADRFEIGRYSIFISWVDPDGEMKNVCNSCAPGASNCPNWKAVFEKTIEDLKDCGWAFKD